MSGGRGSRPWMSARPFVWSAGGRYYRARPTYDPATARLVGEEIPEPAPGTARVLRRFTARFPRGFVLVAPGTSTAFAHMLQGTSIITVTT